MGKKTKKEKELIEEGLDVQMNFAADLAARNPWFKDLYEKYPNRFYEKTINPSVDHDYKEFDRRFAQIWGNIFPTFPFPVLQLEEHEKSPSELVLRIDLNYTKDEIMNRVRQFVDMELKNYRKSRTLKLERKTPRKWRDYIEIWDLKHGYPPWIRNRNNIPFAPNLKKGKNRPWTYEEIAKFKYPDMQTPDKLNKAINKIKKQYRAAYKLICGKKYNAQEFSNLKSQIEKFRNKKLCDECPDKPHCEDLCPQMLQELASIEINRQHKIPNKFRIPYLQETQVTPSAPVEPVYPPSL